MYKENSRKRNEEQNDMRCIEKNKKNGNHKFNYSNHSIKCKQIKQSNQKGRGHQTGFKNSYAVYRRCILNSRYKQDENKRMEKYIMQTGMAVTNIKKLIGI